MAILKSWSIPLFLFIVSLSAYVGMVSMQVRHGNLGGPVVHEFLTWFGLAFIAYAAAIFWLERWWSYRGSTGSHNRTRANSILLIAGIWGAGCLFRWLLLQTFPTLSSDVFRYMWDGHVTANGISPYAHAIDAEQLDWLEIPFRARANHPYMASPYMPAAQWFFASIALFYPLEPHSFQVAAVLFDLATAYILSRLLLRVGLPAHRLLVYLWNPLVIVETAQGAHVDALMVLMMMLAVYSMCRWTATPGRRSRLAFPAFGGARLAFSVLTPALLALATLTKLIPLLIAPVFWWRWNWGSRLLYGYLVIAMLLSPALRAGWGLTGEVDGRGLFGALRIYQEKWKFNSGLFYWLEKWLIEMGVSDSMPQAQEITFFLLFLLLLGAWLWSRRVSHDLRATLRWMAVTLAGYLLLAATVHPWYLLALMPFLPLLTPGSDESGRVWLWPLPWLWLSGALVFSYITYTDPANLRELEWVRQWEWLPTLGLLSIALFWWAKESNGRLETNEQAESTKRVNGLAE